jgi:hypothetical protein
MARFQRGVALVTVILILLVLTVLGIAATVMMTQEDRMSSRQELQKEAFYAAEAGLRRGESVLRGVSFLSLGDLLRHAAVASSPVTTPPVPQQPVAHQISTWDLAHLGTYLVTGGAELAGVEVPVSLGGGTGVGRRAFFSVYVRNNPEDVGGPTSDSDRRIRLLTVGWVAAGDGRPLAMKVLEEEFNLAGTEFQTGPQIGGNPSGVGSGQFGG